MEKNYGTMETTMALWKQLWYYGINYGTIRRTMKFRFMKNKKRGRLPKSMKL